jgi:hypothetical protein
MNTLKIYEMLNTSYEIMKQNDNEITRKAVLALLALYNEAAAGCPEVYQQLKNGMDTSEVVWIVTA